MLMMTMMVVVGHNEGWQQQQRKTQQSTTLVMASCAAVPWVLGCAFHRIPAGFQNLAKRHHHENMWKFEAPECAMILS
jgi:hypothetical protein